MERLVGSRTGSPPVLSQCSCVLPSLPLLPHATDSMDLLSIALAGDPGWDGRERETFLFCVNSNCRGGALVPPFPPTGLVEAQEMTGGEQPFPSWVKAVMCVLQGEGSRQRVDGAPETLSWHFSLHCRASTSRLIRPGNILPLSLPWAFVEAPLISAVE